MPKPRLLFLTSRFPYPLDKGDKLRAFHLIRRLSSRFDIFLFAISDTEPDAESMNALRPWCREMEIYRIHKISSLFSILKHNNTPFQVAYFYSAAAMKRIKAFQSKHRTEAVFCHLIRMAEYARALPHPRILDYMDTFSKGVERMKATSSFWLNPALDIEQKRLMKYEGEVFGLFDERLIISQQDRDHIPHAEKEKIKVVPNGVDSDYYHPMVAEKRYDLLFNGHLSYPPNIASAEFLAREIFPLVKKTRPETTLLIAGADPVAAVRRLEGDGITVQGRVPDIRPAFAASKILVAPMLISIGLQNKILQAMAMKIPSVVSALANNALGAVDGEQVMVATEPEEYANIIVRLLDDEALRTSIGEAAYDFVLNNYNWDRNVSALADAIMKLIRK